MNLTKMKELAVLKENIKTVKTEVNKAYELHKTSILKKALYDFDMFFIEQEFKVMYNNGTKRKYKFYDLEVELFLLDTDTPDFAGVFKMLVSTPETSYDIMLINKAPVFSPERPPLSSDLEAQIDIARKELAFLNSRLENLTFEEWYYVYEKVTAEEKQTAFEDLKTFKSLRAVLMEEFEE